MAGAISHSDRDPAKDGWLAPVAAGASFITAFPGQYDEKTILAIR